MKKALFTKIIFITLIAIFFTLSTYASGDIINESSDALVNLEILLGDGKGNLNLNNNVTRCEFVTLVNRMMGYDEDELPKNLTIPFKDIDQKHWAYKNVKIALNYGLIKGYLDNTLKPDNYVSRVEAEAILVRALGYENKVVEKWPKGIIDKSSELGINKNLDINQDKLLTRGEACVLIYNALSVTLISSNN
ncbi:MAG TPA: S-layer homology domain-containing protein [Clostridiales bacterium]|nr:S-layer homology domain-containing protein [Clostridiales bacterium]